MLAVIILQGNRAFYSFKKCTLTLGREPRHKGIHLQLTRGSPAGSAGKESACNVGDLGSVPGLRRSPGEGNGYPLQYSGLENSMDCIVHGVTRSRTRPSNFHFLFFPADMAQIFLVLSHRISHDQSIGMTTYSITEMAFVKLKNSQVTQMMAKECYQTCISLSLFFFWTCISFKRTDRVVVWMLNL